jgi:phage baseplate assembly protein gpV
VGLIPIGAVGLANALVRVRSGGITQPWLVHTLYNAALSAGLYAG